MPFPNQAAQLPSVAADTEAYTQQGSGIIRRYTLGQVRDFIADSIEHIEVISGYVQGSNLILSMSDMSEIVIPNVAKDTKHHLTAGIPIVGLGFDGDTACNLTNGDLYERISGNWVKKFDLASFIAQTQVAMQSLAANEPTSITIYQGQSGGVHKFRSLAIAPTNKILASVNMLGQIVLDIDSDSVLEDSTTDALPEGTANLYFTNSRVHAALSNGSGVDTIVGGSIKVKLSSDAGNLLAFGTDGGILVTTGSAGSGVNIMTVTLTDTTNTVSISAGKLVSHIAVKSTSSPVVCSCGTTVGGSEIFDDYEVGSIETVFNISSYNPGTLHFTIPSGQSISVKLWVF